MKPFANQAVMTPAGFKPTTSGTGILRSIQLNYEAEFYLFKFIFL